MATTGQLHIVGFLSDQIGKRRFFARLLPQSQTLLFLLLMMPTVIFAQSYLKQFPLDHQSKYFDFRYRGSPERIKAIARFADEYVGIINREFFRADYKYPIRVLVLEDRSALQRFVHQQFAVSEPPNYGIFLYRYNLFATYENSGLGTFTHEIVHPLVEANLKDRPTWAIEGIPTFFEKFYGYWQGDKLIVKWGYQNPWRIESLGTNLSSLNLKAILATTESPGRYNESDRRMVSMFLWEQGRFKQFLQLLQKREKNGYNSYFEAAMRMPLDEVLPLWDTYLKNVAARRREIMRLPPSTLFENESAFQRFVNSLE